MVADDDDVDSMLRDEVLPNDEAESASLFWLHGKKV
jgi:hypothetical protein